VLLVVIIEQHQFGRFVLLVINGSEFRQRLWFPRSQICGLIAFINILLPKHEFGRLSLRVVHRRERRVRGLTVLLVIFGDCLDGDDSSGRVIDGRLVGQFGNHLFLLLSAVTLNTLPVQVVQLNVNLLKTSQQTLLHIFQSVDGVQFVKDDVEFLRQQQSFLLA